MAATGRNLLAKIMDLVGKGRPAAVDAPAPSRTAGTRIAGPAERPRSGSGGAVDPERPGATPIVEPDAPEPAHAARSAYTEAPRLSAPARPAATELGRPVAKRAGPARSRSANTARARAARPAQPLPQARVGSAEPAPERAERTAPPSSSARGRSPLAPPLGVWPGPQGARRGLVIPPPGTPARTAVSPVTRRNSALERLRAALAALETLRERFAEARLQAQRIFALIRTAKPRAARPIERDQPPTQRDGLSRRDPESGEDPPAPSNPAFMTPPAGGAGAVVVSARLLGGAPAPALAPAWSQGTRGRDSPYGPAPKRDPRRDACAFLLANLAAFGAMLGVALWLARFAPVPRLRG